MVDDLKRSLTKQPESTAALLQQPVRTATPIILPRVLSLGPEEVTDKERAQEKVEQRGTKRASQAGESSKPKPKKAEPAPPELVERQTRAAARMTELGVPRLEVGIYADTHTHACKHAHILTLTISFCF